MAAALVICSRMMRIATRGRGMEMLLAATPTQCWQLLKRCHARSRITMNMAGGRVSVGQFRYASRTADFASHLRAFAERQNST